MVHVLIRPSSSNGSLAFYNHYHLESQQRCSFLRDRPFCDLSPRASLGCCPFQHSRNSFSPGSLGLCMRKLCVIMHSTCTSRSLGIPSTAVLVTYSNPQSHIALVQGLPPGEIECVRSLKMASVLDSLNERLMAVRRAQSHTSALTAECYHVPYQGTSSS